MKRFFFYFFICLFAYLFISSSVLPPVQAVACSSPKWCNDVACEGDGFCSTSGTCSFGWNCCKVCPAPTSPPPTSPPSYTCNGYCAPAGNCDADTCGSGTCAPGRSCCGACAPAPTSPPTGCHFSGGVCTGSCSCQSGYQGTCFCASVYGQCLAGYANCTLAPTSAPPTPTIGMYTCTGRTDCWVEPGNECAPNLNCTGVRRTGNYSTFWTKCGDPLNPTLCSPTAQCGYDTSCYSTPPSGCPPDRFGCVWYAANDCGGNGTCTVTQRRTAYLWCKSTIDGSDIHCDNACVTDLTCNAGITQTPIPVPTDTPGGPTDTPTPTPTNTPTPTPGPWVKLKNSSFSSVDSIVQAIPVAPVAYDADDDATANFIIGDGGLVAAPIIDLISVNSSAKPSANDWSIAYAPSPYSLTAGSFISYIKARKEYTEITSLDEIDKDGIYIYTGTSPLEITSIPSSLDDYNAIISTASVVNVALASFNPAKSVAILAPEINFSDTTTEATGIFIADVVTTGTNTGQGLKIIGNLVAQSSFVNDREWADINKPAIFISFDQQKYLDLLPYLSIANYEWRQIQ